ncbi:MAG: class I SAM-dependent methyltransferase [Thaumarchaeota archaeon]|nr:class I SAM-dependent methyltransferase [Nitrososphaerota archaeon]MDE1840872.1 class I SAM-dependent methyltransferase [Nitrososphaerota archaeon]MDE1877065.1 class I SAM-dependent methyltransferase [Nitrososphaerota archaeon]
MKSSVSKSSKGLVKQFFGNNAKSYDKVVGLTTFGRDSHWKEEIIKRIIKCDSVLDLACGTGLLTFKIVEKFPDANITGIDITEGYLNKAKSKLKPPHKISFLLYDAEKMNLGTKFDCIISSYIPKYCITKILIERCLCHLNPGGKIILHDFTYPKNKSIRLLWNLYFVILGGIGFFVPRWKEVFHGLPHLIKYTNWVEEYKDVMEKEGLDVEVKHLTLGTSAILTGTKKIQSYFF